MGMFSWLKPKPVGRPAKEPVRDTAVYPQWFQPGRAQAHDKRPAYKPTPRNLRYFGRTPYARRAINAIKHPIAMLDWEIAPIDGVEMNSELERQIRVATDCFEHPNTDDSFRTLLEQGIEEYLHGAGVYEIRMTGDKAHPLWMWPVDGLSIQVFPGWTGAKNEARYLQCLAYGSMANAQEGVLLRNDEIVYIKPNPSPSTPFGMGPLEVAFGSIARQLGVSEYAGLVTSNATPNIMIGALGMDQDAVSALRNYWINEVEAQGKIPIIGIDNPNGKITGGTGLSVFDLRAKGDDALYLKYQEFMKTEIAVCFDLSPQNLGNERDVNRNTSEVAEDRDWDQVIRPTAKTFQSYFTREVIHAKLGFYSLEFRFKNLDRADEVARSNVLKTLWNANAITVDEMRAQLDMPPDPHWGKMMWADVQIALWAARGLKENLDPQLGGSQDLPDVNTNSSGVS